MKTEYNRKMNAVKLLEMELEAKIAAQEAAENEVYIPPSSSEEGGSDEEAVEEEIQE